MKVKPTDRQIWDAMETLSCAIQHIARDAVSDTPKGTSAEVVADNKAENARCASMELSNTIGRIFDKYRQTAF